MYFLVFHVKPSDENLEKNKLKGAYVSCWIASGSIEQAKEIAKREIRLENWEVIEFDEGYEVKKNEYLEGSDGYEFYSQALIDKWVLRVHTYPYE